MSANKALQPAVSTSVHEWQEGSLAHFVGAWVGGWVGGNVLCERLETSSSVKVREVLGTLCGWRGAH